MLSRKEHQRLVAQRAQLHRALSSQGMTFGKDDDQGLKNICAEHTIVNFR